MTITSGAVALPRTLPTHPGRYRLNRAGIRNVWQYDDQLFEFADGRLLLRGKNGAGQSKAMEMLLPFLLDANTRAIDAAGGGKTTLKWLMLSASESPTPVGYLWLELRRIDDDGYETFLTLGSGIKASRSTQTAKAWYFITTQRVGIDLSLVDETGVMLASEVLRTLVGEHNVWMDAAGYQAAVAERVFGIRDRSRYRNLLNLLHQLRRPTIGDKIEDAKLADILTESLPPLDDDLVDSVARSFDDLSSARADMARLESTHAAVSHFLGAYRDYSRRILRERADSAKNAVAAARDAVKAVEADEASYERAEVALFAAHDATRVAAAERENAETELAALKESAGYKALSELGPLRASSYSARATAAIALSSAQDSRASEQAAAAALASAVDGVRETARSVSADSARLRASCASVGIDAAELVAVTVAPVSTPGATVTVAAPLTEGATDAGTQAVTRPSDLVIDREAVLTATRGALTGVQAVATLVKVKRSSIEVALDASRLADASQVKANAARERLGVLDAQVDQAAGQATEKAAAAALAADEWAGRAASWLDVRPDAWDGSTWGDEPARDLLADVVDDETDASLREVVALLLTPDRDDVAARLGTTEAQRATLAVQAVEAQVELDSLQAQGPPPAPKPPFWLSPGLDAVPLHALVDFAPEVTDTDRAGIEAALESSGLLLATIATDGSAFAPSTGRLVAAPGAPVSPSLADVLTPIPGPQADAVAALLASVGLDAQSASATIVGADGSFRVGVLHGAHSKESAEHIGAAARAAARARRIAELERILAGIAGQDSVLAEQSEALRAHQGRLSAWAGAQPSTASALTAVALAHAAAERLDQARAERAAASSEHDAAVLTVRTQRATADAAAASEGLATGTPALEEASRTAATLVTELKALLSEVRRLDLKVEALTWEHVESARVTRAERESAVESALVEWRERVQTVETLEGSLGATEAELSAKVNTAVKRLRHAKDDFAARELDAKAADKAHDRLALVLERSRDDAQSRQVDATGADAVLRTALLTPGLLLAAAGLAPVDVPHLAAPVPEDPALVESDDPAGVVVEPDPLSGLEGLVRAVGRLLPEATVVVSDTTITNRLTELQGKLAGGYDVIATETDGVKMYELADDTGRQPVAAVGQRLAATLDDLRGQLTARESEVFERLLLGELGEHLRAQLNSGRALVHQMNGVLKGINSSHGIGMRLRWLPIDTLSGDVRSAIDKIAKPAAMRTPEENAELQAALRRLIEDARRADPTAGYASHLRAALDYRAWHEFTMWVTDSSTGTEHRFGSRRLSQGEQRFASYVVLFAAAAAHFDAIGASEPCAPRMILLDDAFAKVDEPTHGRLMGLLVDLDLDFVLTSERLWGCFAQVPGLHIYEVKRDPAAHGAATEHYLWNGSHRKLVAT